MDKGYSTREVAKLVDLTPRQVRTLAQAGVVGPVAKGGSKTRPGASGVRLRFAFGDLLVLRTVRRLLAAGLPLVRVGKALQGLRRQLARRNIPLSGALCAVEDGRVVASDGSVRWDVESGESLGAVPGGKSLEAVCLPIRPEGTLNFAPTPRHPFAGEVRWPRKPFFAGHGAYGHADSWFNRGLEAEQDAPNKACGFYLQAIACNPEHVEAMINLGHLCAAERDRQRAAAFFRLATRVDPEHPVAHFNLAVILHDEGECGAAMQAYRKALLLDPQFADAHFNLGTLLAQQGHNDEAGTHFTAFHAATQAGPPTR